MTGTPELTLRWALDRCTEIEQRMIDLRSAAALPDDWHDPDSFIRAVEDVRARLDQAELVMREVRRFRRRVRFRASRAKQARDDAYDKRLSELAEGAVRREYESVRDREVQARTFVLAQTREQRAWDAVRDRADEAFEAVREAYFGLKDIRGELLDLLRFLPWVSHLEH